MTAATNPLALALSGDLPDWRNPDAYPDPDVASLETWANEFMARNPDFSREANQLHAWSEENWPAVRDAPSQPSIYGKPVPVHEYFAALNAAVAGLVQKYGAQHLPYEREMGVPTRTYAELFGHAYELINQLYAELARWRGEPSPGQHFNPLPEPRDSPDREYWIMQKEHAQFVIRFNLEYPLKFQLAEAEKRLKEERNRAEQQAQINPVTNRQLVKRAELYRTYLRALDAETSGASIREIAQVLFPHRGNEGPDYLGDRAVRYALEAAQKLRDGDYRNLPLLEK